MNQAHLHQLLSELHAELTSAGSVDSKNKKMLERLAEDIRPLVEAGPTYASAVEYEGLRGRLTEAVTAFEAAHPQLGRTITNLVDTLVMYNL